MEGVFIRSCGTENWAGRWEWFCEDLPVSSRRGGLAGFGVGAGADPAGFWRRLEYSMPAELLGCGESRGFMGRPTTRRGTRADGRRDQREQRWPVVLYRRVRMCRAVSSVAMSGGRNGLGLSRVFWRVSWRVLREPWRLERPGAAHNWTDLAAPPTSGASTSVGHGWVSSPSPPSLQISTHTVDSQPTLCPLHLLSAAQ